MGCCVSVPSVRFVIQPAWHLPYQQVCHHGVFGKTRWSCLFYWDRVSIFETQRLNKRHFPPLMGETVVWHKRCSISAHMLTTVPATPAQGISGNGPERRRHVRTRTRQGALIRTEAGLAFPVLIADVSKGGLGLICDHLLERQTIVIIEWRHRFFIGCIRHVSRKGSSFVFGVQLESLNAHRGLISEMLSSATVGDL